MPTSTTDIPNGTTITDISENDAAHIHFREKGPQIDYKCFSCTETFAATSLLNVMEHYARIEHRRFHSECLYCRGHVHKYYDSMRQAYYYHDCARWKLGADK